MEPNLQVPFLKPTYINSLGEQYSIAFLHKRLFVCYIIIMRNGVSFEI